MLSAKYALFGVCALCLTVLCFTWMLHSRLTELSIKAEKGSLEVRAILTNGAKK